MSEDSCVGFVNGEAARIGVVAAEGAAGGGVEGHRKLRAGGAVVDHRWKHPALQSAEEGGEFLQRQARTSLIVFRPYASREILAAYGDLGAAA